MKRNIAFIVERYAERGGTERVTSHVMNALSKKNYSIKLLEIFSTDKTPFVLNSTIKTSFLLKDPYHTIWPEGKRNKFYIFNIIVFKLIKYFIKERIKVAILSSTHHAYYALIAAKICGVKIISWEHFNCRSITDYMPLYLGRLVSARYADFIVTLTEQDKTLWENDFSVKSDIRCIPNIISDYNNVNYSNREKKILACGRISHQKGFDILLDVWEKVSSDIKSKDWTLDIRGGGIETEYGSKLLSKINEKKLSRVEILPSTKNIEEEYKKSSICVGSSRYEGFQLSLAEASSAGLPIVSFDCLCGPSDIVVNGENGYLIPVGSISEMADKILVLMEKDELRINMSRKSKEISQKFYEKNVISLWKAIIDEALTK